MKLGSKQLLMSAAALSAMIFTASTARADHYGCQTATQNLANAQAAYNHAQVMLYNNAQFCPGGWQENAACMMAIANAVNTTTVALQNAQGQQQFECSFGRPPQDGGGWGRRGGRRGGRPGGHGGGHGGGFDGF